MYLLEDKRREGFYRKKDTCGEEPEYTNLINDSWRLQTILEAGENQRDDERIVDYETKRSEAISNSINNLMN